MPAERVPVDVNVGEIVIRADGLNLGERVLQRTPIPKPNVLDRWSIVLEVERFDRRLYIKVTLLNSINAEGAACRRNVVIVVERLLVVGRIDRVDAGVGGEGLLRDAIERERRTGRRDVVRDERSLAHEFIRLHDEVSHVRGNDDGADNIND